MTRLKDRNNLPETFLLLLVSYALFYWDLIPGLSTYTRPNQDFVCYISVASITATTDEGDMATVSALCLGVSGRPWRRLVHNAAGVARAVAVAHTMGLNHDCSGWNIKDLEKCMRWKVWWVVLILDQWSNFAQGTPTYISKGQYDVPLPTMDILLTRKRAQSTKHIRAAEVYLQLCRLTEILGDILPLIYQIHTPTNIHNTASRLSGPNEVLDQWVDNLPHWLNMSDFHERPFVPGLANLQLSYLSVRMLLRRIAWHDAIRTQSDKSCLSSLLSLCQTVAENIVRRDLIAFWLPYNAQHFTSAVTLLLCCALQTNNSSTRSKCMMGARTLVDSLHRHRNENDWDLSELCLSQSEAVLKRMEEALPRLLLNNTLTSIAGSPNIPDHDIEVSSRIVDDMNNGGTSVGYIGTEDEEPTSLAALFPELFRDLSSENFDVTQYDSMYSIFDS
ncbi:unnamed protein product [Clonostachys rhizophaga]|uniref:Xylanolytic transcriptional activator regulatory domain-containing protein n=1 Tax=Clonostachys rhizophaga TaxID=160324 RepID=A0A9N9V9G6_9HYPO|nr:unnamed protein product [Clonostachys rhizophaga]